MKDNYYNSSSVWRSYTTRGQAKGNKEGELLASLGGVILSVVGGLWDGGHGAVFIYICMYVKYVVS